MNLKKGGNDIGAAFSMASNDPGAHTTYYFVSLVNWMKSSSRTEAALNTMVYDSVMLQPNMIPYATSSIILAQSASRYDPLAGVRDPLRVLKRLDVNSAANDYLNYQITFDSYVIALSGQHGDEFIGASFSTYVNTIYEYDTGVFHVYNASKILSIVFGSLIAATIIIFIFSYLYRHLRYQTFWKRAPYQQPGLSWSERRKILLGENKKFKS